MKILFITSAFNGLSQRAWVELDRLNHQVKVHLSSTSQNMIDAVSDYEPDLIIAPYLKMAIPGIIWKKYTCLIIHPGIPGDRGSSSLDWAILNNEEEWGVTILEAREKMDAGPIWATAKFPMRHISKSSLYRHEVTGAAMEALLIAVKKLEEKNFTPISIDAFKTNRKGKWNRPTNHGDFRFSWSETTDQIIRKINAADSSPGALCNILQQEYYCYGAVKEETFRGEQGMILGVRDNAVCIATSDGALWLQCLKQVEPESIKLPATLVLENELENVPDLPVDIFERDNLKKTFREIRYEEANDVGYLHFDFYNGAMSIDQCKRLKNAFVAAGKRNTKVIVLVGGEDIWSNGIHLNVIESADNPPQEAWENINAINDLIREIICTDSHYVISAMQGNAGGGGVALALAADKVLARKGIVFNPHTRNIGLYGSEYWTYLLPRRIGIQRALQFNEQCLPWGTAIAMEVKLIDDCFENTVEEFSKEVRLYAELLASASYLPQLLAAKKFKRNRDESYKPLEKYREEELEIIRKNFFEDDWNFSWKRFCFVHKINGSENTTTIVDRDLFSERRKIWRRRKSEKLFYEV